MYNHPLSHPGCASQVTCLTHSYIIVGHVGHSFILNFHALYTHTYHSTSISFHPGTGHFIYPGTLRRYQAWRPDIFATF